jgi:hypothetical protein
MTTYHPPHDAQDEAKLAALMAVLQRGEDLPPIVVHGITAFTGSHRHEAYLRAWALADNLDEAWENVPAEIPVVEMSDEDYAAMCEELGVGLGDHDQCGDYNAIAAAIYQTTTDDAVREALKDQVYDD